MVLIAAEVGATAGIATTRIGGPSRNHSSDIIIATRNRLQRRCIRRINRMVDLRLRPFTTKMDSVKAVAVVAADRHLS